MLATTVKSYFKTSGGEASVPLPQIPARESPAGGSVIRLREGHAAVWGPNSYGQFGLGHGDPVSEDSPADLAGDPGTEYAAGGTFNLKLTPDGKLWAAGKNDKGQLGNAGGDSSVWIEITAP